MIASLRGEVLALGADYCVIECAGVGYQVGITPRTAATLTRHQETLLLTQMIVREDAMTLFGFASNEEREMFGLLRTVSTVGPKVALAILTVMTPVEIANAVANKNTKALQAATGVGKRLAERLIVELKEKVAIFASPVASSDVAAGNPVATPLAVAADINQVAGALTGLGFAEDEAVAAVETVVREDPTLDTSLALRAALKMLGK